MKLHSYFRSAAVPGNAEETIGRTIHPRRDEQPWLMRPFLLLAALAMFGCATIGPRTVSRDRFDYSSAVAESWKTQMLLNLVKIRYGDTPVFMDVGQVVAGYQFQGGVSAGFTAADFTPNNDILGLGGATGAQLQYTDRPTITYTPLVGEKFARSLMMPIPPSAILSVIQAGYPVDMVFRLAVQSINGVDNRRVYALSIVPANPEFYEVLTQLGRIQVSGDIGAQVVPKAGQEGEMKLIFRPNPPSAVESSMIAAARMLGLNSKAREFRVVYGTVPSNNKEIAMLSRSILEVLTDLSSQIEAPEADVKAHEVRAGAEADQGPEGLIPPLIRIVSSTNRPDHAFVATQYQGYWFSIDKRDIMSKQLFTFLMFLFTFVETPSTSGAPVLTIPAQ